MPKSRLGAACAERAWISPSLSIVGPSIPDSEKDYLKTRGADGKSRKKAVLTDDEVLSCSIVPESWGNVAKISRVFGVRPWEIEFIRQANNDDGEPRLRVSRTGPSPHAGSEEETGLVGLSP